MTAPTPGHQPRPSRDPRMQGRRAARPVIVHDGNPDALTRRQGALTSVLGEGASIATPSATAVHLLAMTAREGTAVLVDLCAADRPSLDRPGERIIERLTSRPATAHVRPIAWSAHVGADVVAGARAAGAAGFVTATMRRDVEAEELRRVLAGEAVWPRTASASDAWDDWFMRTYGTAWHAWMAPVLVRLAETGQRRSVAADLVTCGAARSVGHGATRMRDVARIIAGEHSNSPTVVAARANVALARLAARGTLAERPVRAMSLSLGAEALRASPSLAFAAGLGAQEVDDILSIDHLIRSKQAEAGRGAGAPPADTARLERRWAAGRRAIDYGAGVQDVDTVITGILHRLDRALIAIDDAQVDEERYPVPRAAAALLAAQQVDPRGLDAVVTRSGALTWQGRSAAQLAVTGDVSDDQAREFTARVDRWLVARGQSGA